MGDSSGDSVSVDMEGVSLCGKVQSLFSWDWFVHFCGQCCIHEMKLILVFYFVVENLYELVECRLSFMVYEIFELEFLLFFSSR